MSRMRARFVALLCWCSPPRVMAQVPVLLDANWIGFEAGIEAGPFAPSSLAIGDIDNDGDLDVLTGNDYWQGPGVAVLRNAGDGSFATRDYYQLPIGQEPGSVALADFDGDGFLDAFATLPGWEELGTTFRVWRNDGAGRLTMSGDYTVGEGPQGIVVSDLDGDGFQDVVTANHGRVGRGRTLSLVKHNGGSGPAAGFLGAVAVDVSPRPFRLANADLNGDGAMDLVVARGDTLSDTVVTVLVNDRSGAFPAPFAEYPAGRSYKPAVGLADLDGDGDVDLVTSQPDATGENVVVRRNDGGAVFGAATSYPLGMWSPVSVGFAFADVDRNGATDILTTNPSGRSFEGWRALRNNGSGGFLAAERYETAQNTEAIAAFDADGDGDVDVVSLAHSSSTLALHRNPGSGIFPRTTRFPTASFPSGLAASDLDADGDLDVALADNVKVHLHFNDGAGGLGVAVSSRPTVSPASFHLHDLDGDGLDDMVVPGQGVFIARNLGGSFAVGQTTPIGVCNLAMDAGDLDGDGDPDLATADCDFPYVVHLLRNDGGLVFADAGSVAVTVPSNRVLITDADNDGRQDLIVHQGGYGVYTFRGLGGFAYQPEQVSLINDVPYLMALHDFNQDGITDLAMQVPADAFGTDRVGIARGRGDGTFLDPGLRFGSSVLENLRNGIDLDIADLDCDGLDDVIVTSYAANDLGFFRSRGDGSLEPEVRYGPGLTPQQTVLGDFTGDGVTDAVTTIHAGGTTCCEEALALLRGLCGCSVDPIPPDQGNVLMAVRAGVDVELSWGGATASRWRIYRDSLKTALGRTPLAPDTLSTRFTDWVALPRASLDYYRVKGLSPCSFTPGP